MTEILDGPDALVGLREIGIIIPMFELYADLVFAAADDEAEAEV